MLSTLALVATLAAGNNTDLVFEQAVRWKPRVVSVARESDAIDVARSGQFEGRLTAFALGTLAAFTGLILLIGDQWLPRDLYWLGALLVALIVWWFKFRPQSY